MTDREIIDALIDAWESLAGGRRYRPQEVDDWLRDKMSPAINMARKHIGRKRPDEK